METDWLAHVALFDPCAQLQLACTQPSILLGTRYAYTTLMWGNLLMGDIRIDTASIYRPNREVNVTTFWTLWSIFGQMQRCTA